MNDDYKLYVLATLAYKKEHPELTEEVLFPIKWNESKNYLLKTNIIYKAIKSNKFIYEIEEYENI